MISELAIVCTFLINITCASTNPIITIAVNKTKNNN